jgi:hypothetical protein
MWIVFASVLAVFLLLLASWTAYLIWYAKSGRYELDRRVDAATK